MIHLLSKAHSRPGRQNTADLSHNHLKILHNFLPELTDLQLTCRLPYATMHGKQLGAHAGRKGYRHTTEAE